MNRRSFLVLLGAVTTVATAAIVGRRVAGEHLGRQLVRLEGFGRPLVDRLRSHYQWLSVESAAFERYVADHQRHYGRLGRFSIPDADFYTRFLLSTDFFTHGAENSDGPDLVHYTTYYLPGVPPCHNPFFQPPPSDEELAHDTRPAKLG